jgi:putative NADPH-quinone reductase
MKVLGVVGGPHREGNTVRLVEAVLEGAREAGHETVLVKLADLDVRHIEEKDGRLYYPDDDMARKLGPHLESMGALVLGTPIYYDHVDSRMKQFIDRLHYWSKTHGDEYRRRFPDDVKVVNCITCGWDDPEAYDDILAWMRERMEHYWRMRHVADLRAEGTGSKPVSSRKDLLERARRIGRSL